MRNNWNALMNSTVDVQRADVDVNTSTVRDRRVAKYDTIASSQRCYIEPGPVQYSYDDRLAQVPLKSFNVYFNAGVNVLEGDRLKEGSTYYLVLSVQDYSTQGFGVVCSVQKKTYAMVAP